MIDIHSHILPGIDDGARTLDESVELVRELASYGVTTVVATPHFVDETIYTSPKNANSKLVTKLRRCLKEEGINVKVVLGNEIYINPMIVELIKAGEVSKMGRSKYLLVELPMTGDFPNYEDIFLDLMQNGFKVVLAHPERYESFKKDFSLVRDLYDMGVLLQCNLGSISGKYGKNAKKLVTRLIKERMVFAFGSDIHHPSHTDYYGAGLKKLRKYYTETELETVLVDNPGTIVA